MTEGDQVRKMCTYVDTAIPQMQQSQMSTEGQLRVLRRAAVRLGLYDADDALNTLMSRRPSVTGL